MADRLYGAACFLAGHVLVQRITEPVDAKGDVQVQAGTGIAFESLVYVVFAVSGPQDYVSVTGVFYTGEIDRSIVVT